MSAEDQAKGARSYRTSPKGRKVSLNLTSRADEAMEYLAVEHGLTQTDAFNRGLIFLAYVLQNQDRGRRLVHIAEDGTIVENVHLF